jgi:hypothetical protein
MNLQKPDEADAILQHAKQSIPKTELTLDLAYTLLSIDIDSALGRCVQNFQHTSHNLPIQLPSSNFVCRIL